MRASFELQERLRLLPRHLARNKLTRIPLMALGEAAGASKAPH